MRAQTSKVLESSFYLSKHIPNKDLQEGGERKDGKWKEQREPLMALVAVLTCYPKEQEKVKTRDAGDERPTTKLPDY